MTCQNVAGLINPSFAASFSNWLCVVPSGKAPSCEESSVCCRTGSLWSCSAHRDLPELGTER